MNTEKKLHYSPPDIQVVCHISADGGGTALCGVHCVNDTAIDTGDLSHFTWVTCPLCELAMLAETMHMPGMIQGSLW